MTTQCVRGALSAGLLWICLGSCTSAQSVPANPEAPTPKGARTGSGSASDTVLTAGSHEEVGIHEGLVSGNIYTNPFFGFSVEIPQGWKVKSNAAFRTLQEKAKQQAEKSDPEVAQMAQGDEVDSPLLLMGESEVWNEGPHRRLVQILSTDISKRPGQPSAEGFLQFLAKAYKKRAWPVEYTREYIGTPEPVVLGGRELWKVYFTQTSSVVWHGAHFAMIEKGHVLQFILMSPDEAGLRALEPIMRTLHFRPAP